MSIASEAAPGEYKIGVPVRVVPSAAKGVAEGRDVDPAFVARFVLLGLGSYFLGSVSFAHLVAAKRGVDLRATGSGVAGVANVRHTLGLFPAGLALLGDFAKAAIPVGLTAWAISPEMGAAAAIGVMLGHNWPAFRGLEGGRGLAVALGTASILVPRELGILLVLLLPMAFLLRDTAPPAALALVLAPVLAWRFGEPFGVTLAFAVLAGIVFFRRLTGPPKAKARFRSLVSRLIFDRPEFRRRWALDRNGKPDDQ